MLNRLSHPNAPSIRTLKVQDYGEEWPFGKGTREELDIKIRVLEFKNLVDELELSLDTAKERISELGDLIG